MESLTMNDTLRIRLKDGDKEFVLQDLYNACPDKYSNEEDFLKKMEILVKAGMAVKVINQSSEEDMADKVIKEMEDLNKAESIRKDRVAEQESGMNNCGVYKKVAFSAKSGLDADEMEQVFIKNFNIDPDSIYTLKKGGEINVIVENIPVKKYISISRYLGIKNTADVVTRGVNKMANTAVNGVDLTLNSLAVPVAKTTIATGTKIASATVGMMAKLAGIGFSTVSRGVKQTARDIKNDPYIAEAKGEVVDNTQKIRKAWNEHAVKSGARKGATIIDR